MMRWVVGSIPHGRPIELFLTTGLTKTYLWDGAYKRPLAANKKSSPVVAAAG